ncbi:Uncharacterised protein [Shigella flexneri]|nr:Uncharacterised protein [Shigella flexneri]
MRPQGNFFALFRTHAPGNHHAALLSPEEPVALFFTFQTRRFTQPRFVVLPPVTQTLLPAKPGIVHFAIQRFSKRAVDMDSPRMKRTESVVDGRNQPTCGDILGRARQ